MTLYYESELKHYGIPGMKWGHRKAKAMAANVSRQIEGNSNSATRKKAQKINASRSIPSKIGTFVLTGWGGNRTYNTGQATGRGKIKSGAYALGASVVGSTLGSSFGNVVA